MMRKAAALLLALALLCAASAGLAEASVPNRISEFTGLPAAPALSAFASMKTRQRGNTVTITLNKPVDKLQANWLGHGESPEELTVSENLTATLNTAGHRYQVGAGFANRYWQDISYNSWTVITYPADPADLKAARQAAEAYQNSYYDCTQVVRPIREVYRLDNDCFVTYFDQDVSNAEIEQKYPPSQYYIVNVDGYAYVWHQVFSGSDGSPNYAYITNQGDWTVVYSRSGTVQYFYVTMWDTSLFGIAPGTATVIFQKCNTGWYIREVQEVYADGTYIRGIYSRTGSGIKVRQDMSEIYR